MSNLMTPEFRVSYPFVFTPQANKEDPTREPKYSVTMLFKKGEDLTKLRDAVVDVLTEKFGPKEKWPKNLRLPFRDQADKEKDGKMPEGYTKGAVFVTASGKQKPGVVDQNVNDIIDSSQFYAGCYARATVRAFYYDAKGNKGVAFGLQNVQKLRDGEPLGNRMRAQDEFKPVEGADPLAEATGTGMDLLS